MARRPLGLAWSARCAAHSGLGRVVLTSRRLPATDVTGLAVLSRWTRCRRTRPCCSSASSRTYRPSARARFPASIASASRRLARRALEAAQGHPKLLELADGQAAHPERLVRAGEGRRSRPGAEQGGLPEGFFTDGESAATGADYLQILAAWTKSVAETLTLGDRDLFWLLCCLEEGERERPIVEGYWPHLWDALGGDGQPPELDRALAAVAARGLASIHGQTSDGYASYCGPPGSRRGGARTKPGRSSATSVDGVGAALLDDVFAGTRPGGRVTATLNTWLLVRAGLAVVPYLIRQHQWDAAAALLGDAFLQEPSRANAVAMLPAIAADRPPRPAAGGACWPGCWR